MADDVESLTNELNAYLVAKDKKGRVLLHLALLATVYIEAPYAREVREAIVACCQDYFQRCGHQLRWALNPDTRFMEPFGQGKGSNPSSWLLALGEDESFALIYHGAAYKHGADAHSMIGVGTERRPYVDLGYVRVSFPVLWFASHPGSFLDAVLELCRKLKPVSGYGGIGVVESPDPLIMSEYEPRVFQLAQRFPGLEVDYPGPHSIWLDKGIKGVNWLTVLGDKWLAPFGGADALEAELAALDRRFAVHRYDGGVVIQAGPRPDLGDATRNLWPELYVKLAKHLRPIRVPRHGPMQHGHPAGVPHFDKERTEAWLRRFDDR